jgi:ribosomal protein S6
MRRYETIFITKPDLDDDGQKGIQEKLKGVVSQHAGNVHHAENLGKQRLGYEIAGHPKGVFHYFGYEGNTETLLEIERSLKLNESVIKFQSFRVEGDFQPQLVFPERIRPFGPRGRRPFGGGDFGRGDDEGFGGDELVADVPGPGPVSDPRASEGRDE